VQTDAKLEARAANSRPKIPVEMNGMVQKWIDYFTQKDRDRFERYMAREAYYRPMIEATLRRQGVPEELYYLGLIESGFQVDARSHASAVGPWQFVHGTAKRYGLKVGVLVDERRDPIRSTEAVGRYLADLHNVFHNWFLAIAAYNAGEQRILNAIFRGGSRDFWTLVRRGALPRETMDYVPKFLAALIIGNNARRYQLDTPKVTPHPEVELVSVPPLVRLSEVSHRSGLEASRIGSLNPQLPQGLTPPDRNYEVWVPKDRMQRIAQLAPSLTRVKLRIPDTVRFSRAAPSRAPAIARATHYRVKRGDNLFSIAKRFGVTVTHIRHLNRLRKNYVVAGQHLKIHENSGRI
jgi:membrane-bound lytic murein transglycosylase D